MSNSGLHSILIELDKQIQSELLAMQDTLGGFPDTDLDQERYTSFMSRIGYIDAIFQKTDRAMENISFDRSEPDLYTLLELKDRIYNNRGRFSRMSREFHKRFDKHEKAEESELSRNISHSVLPQEEGDFAEDMDETLEDESTTSDIFEDVEELDAEKGKKDKKRKTKEASERQAKRFQQIADQNRIDAAAIEAERLRSYQETLRQREEELYKAPYQGPDILPSSFQPVSPAQPTYSSFDLHRQEYQNNQYESYQPAPSLPADYAAPSQRQVSQTDLRDEEYREADRRAAEERRRQESLQHSKELVERAHEHYNTHQYEYDVAEKAHFDFSVVDGSYGSRHNGRTEYKNYSFAPSGTVETTLPSASFSPELRQPLHTTFQPGTSISRDACSVYEDEMRYRMQMARLQYEEKRGSSESKDAFHQYVQERNNLFAYRDHLRSGQIETTAPVIHAYQPSSIQSRDYYADARSAHYQYTPQSIVGSAISDGQRSGSYAEYHNSNTASVSKKLTTSLPYTAERPLHVMPSYETALYERMVNSRQALRDVVHTVSDSGQPIHIPTSLVRDVREANRAYEGFQAAKTSGAVILSDSAPARSIDYTLWQSHRFANLEQNQSFSRSPVYKSLLGTSEVQKYGSYGRNTAEEIPSFSRQSDSVSVPFHVLREKPTFPVPPISPKTYSESSTHYNFADRKIDSSDIRKGPQGVNGSEWLNKLHPQNSQREQFGNNEFRYKSSTPYNVLRKQQEFPVPPVVPGTSREEPLRFKVKDFRIDSSTVRTGPNGLDGNEWFKTINFNAKKKSNDDGPDKQNDRRSDGTGGGRRGGSGGGRQDRRIDPSGDSGFDDNRGRKADTKEVSSDVLGRDIKFKTSQIAKRYGKALTNQLSNYSVMSVMMLSRKAYHMIQSCDEQQTLRAFETGRYYITTAVGVANAVIHARTISSARTAKSGANKEHMFGSVSQMSKKEFSRELQLHKEKGRALKEEIAALKKKGISSLTGDELATLSQKIKEKACLDKEGKKLFSLRELRLQNAAALELDRLIEAEAKGGPIRVHHVDKVLKRIQKESEERINKKFGSIKHLNNKQLHKEIQLATEEARSLKKQIKLLKAKGSLSVAQSENLARLVKRKAELDEALRKMHGLSKERSKLARLLNIGDEKRSRMSKNNAGLLGGLYALQDFILKPLREGDQIGAHGLAKAAQIASNRHVHAFVKTSVRYSISTGKWAVRKTHLDKLGKAAIKKAAASAPVQKVKAVHIQTKKVAKTAANATKKAIERMTPRPVKTAVRGSQRVLSSIADRYRRVQALIRGAIESTKNWFYNTTVGRAFAWCNRMMNSVFSAIKSVFSFLKSLAIKILLGAVGFVLLVQLIVAVILFLGSTVSSVILSPDATEDGKFDLSPYNAILVSEWKEYEEELLAMGDAEGYYNVTVEMEPNVPNTREILSMMAVRMSQRLDIKTNLEIEPYLSQLVRDLNPYVRTEGTCYCEGRNCRTGTYTVTESTTDDEGNVVTTEHKYYFLYCNGDHPTLTIKLQSLHFDAAFAADSLGAADAKISGTAGDLIGHFTITHYCAEEYPHICNAGPPYKTATGTTPTAGRTIAVDPSVIPLNTHVIINGHEYVAEDTGGAIDDNRIDIVVPTHAEALKKGTLYNVPVYNVSYDGEDIMESGTWNGWTAGNIEWAKTIYSQDWTELYSGIPNVTDLIGNNTDLSGVEFTDGDRPGNSTLSDIGRAQLGNAGGSKFWRWYGFDYRVEWCAIFVSWCADQGGILNSHVPKFALCEDGVSWFQNRGQWASAGDIVPSAGDIIFFDWEPNGDVDHVGIVVGTDGSNVYTVEGNSGDQVRTKSYSLNSPVIFGYGLPNY